MDCETATLGDIGMHYRIRVLLTHPEIDLQVITATTGLSPSRHWTKGDKRVTPHGRELPGFHQASMWSYWVDVENTREFADSVAKVLDLMAPARAVIHDLISTNGQATLIIELSGTRNIGDVIAPAALAKIAGLGLSLGIEVFPG